jgi:hypothetical protein
MEWKQPEGIRKHWVMEELDTELLFSQTPVGAAQGRIGDDVYNLRDGGVLRKKRTLLSGSTVLATLEEKTPAGAGVLTFSGREFQWKPVNTFGTRWALFDEAGKTVFTYVSKRGLAKVARVEPGEAMSDAELPLLLLCWYVMAL